MTEQGSGKTRKKILLVDDEAPLRALVSATLEASHYEFLQATNGKEGLEVARREKPELILLDVAMPEIDGFEVCRQLKADPETSGITIIILTALSQEANRRRGREVGADGYIVKPFSPTALLKKAQEILGP